MKVISTGATGWSVRIRILSSLLNLIFAGMALRGFGRAMINAVRFGAPKRCSRSRTYVS